MEPQVMTHDLAARIEKKEVEAHLSRMAALQKIPSNPLQVELQGFDRSVAFIVRGEPYLPLARVVGFGSGDQAVLDDLIAWFHQRGSPIRLMDISPFHSDEDLLHLLADRGLFQGKFINVYYTFLEGPLESPDYPVGVMVREFPSEELGAFAHLAVQIDEIPEVDWPLWEQVFKAQFAEWHTYIAYVGGKPAAHAALFMRDGVAVLMNAVTAPQFRGYGAQTALLRQRIADAAAAGCDLLTCASYPGTSSQRNQERAGLRLAYTKACWMEK